MSAAKSIKSAAVSSSAQRKPVRRRAGTKTASSTPQVDLVRKRVPARPVVREAAKKAPAKSQAQPDPGEKGKTMIERSAPGLTPESKAISQELPVADMERTAQDDTEVVLTASVDRDSGADSTLSKYFREMANHRVLTPKEEIDAAREGEKLEIGYWEALFCYAPAFETVIAVVERNVEDATPLAVESVPMRKLARAAKRGKFLPAQQSRWTKLSNALSTKLRVLDSDRLFVAEAYQAVHRLAGVYSAERDIAGGEGRITPAFKRYLTTVEHGRRAQSDAKNRFVAANLRLVVSIARRYNRGRLP